MYITPSERLKNRDPKPSSKQKKDAAGTEPEESFALHIETLLGSSSVESMHSSTDEKKQQPKKQELAESADKTERKNYLGDSALSSIIDVRV